MSLLDKINRLLPGNSARRRAAKTLYDSTLKLKKSAKSFVMVFCEEASLNRQGISLRGWLLTQDDGHRLEFYLNGELIGRQIPEVERNEIADYFFFVENWVCAGFEFQAPCKPDQYKNEVTIRAVTDANTIDYNLKLDNTKKASHKILTPNVDKLTSKIAKKNKYAGEYIEDHKIIKIENFLSLFIALNFDTTKPDLIIDHQLGGGSNYYRKTLADEKTAGGGKVLIFTYHRQKNEYSLELSHKHMKAELKGAGPDDIIRFLKINHFKSIIINNLVSFRKPERLLFAIGELKERFNSRLVVALHDYYPVCPSYNLINDRGGFCGIPDLETCEKCMKANSQEEILHKPESMAYWRDTWLEILEKSDEITCFSNASRDLLLRAYPSVKGKRLKVKPHSVAPLEKPDLSKITGQKIIIGIPGRIHYPKGSLIVKDMVREIEKRYAEDVRIVIIGELADRHIRSGVIEATGPYERESLPKIIEEKNINIMFIPSIWPETFSYTTEEAIIMGMPVAVFDLGAPAERVKNYDKGLIIDDINPAKALEVIIDFMKK